MTRPNGINTNYGYDSVSHLLSVLHQAGSTTLDGASYGYDYAGNRTSKTNYLNGITSNYGYDAIYELQQVTQGGGTTESYSYDAVGNRLSSSGVPTYSYNPSNELTSTSSGSYTYDANGNTLSDPSGKSYSWDYENRLVQAVVPGTGTVAFKYDPFGRRVQKSGPLGTMNYVYDSADIVEELDSAGGALARYTRTQNIDEPLAEFRSGATSYYLTDGLRSVTSLTDTSATVVATYGYDAFGNLSNSTGSIGNSFRYTGREFDPESGLHYYRTRYHDSAVGRFTSEDLTRFKGGTNFYPYVNNRPVTFTDPIGTCLLQLVTSPNAHAEACGLEPKTNDRCACLCAISPNFEGCMKDCKDGCLSSRLNPVEVCQCLCNKGKENGTLNWFEARLCKQGCKRNLK
jgi:RHS repeat-associated protein